MRRLLATIPAARVTPWLPLLGPLLCFLALGLAAWAVPAPSVPEGAPPAPLFKMIDPATEIPPVLFEVMLTAPVLPAPLPWPEPPDLAAAARVFLLRTAAPGGTMTRQGPAAAIAPLHPDFAVRLAAAIEAARMRGLPRAGIFSAYRPPGFGVGGFRDKFRSLHSYGLAVDMTGIGRRGSATVRLWHAIAAEHGIACPYGPRHRSEFNHCQWLQLRAVPGRSELRATVTARGPRDLQHMWQAAATMREAGAAPAARHGRRQTHRRHRARA